jgi:hypothetical protein
MPTVQAMLAQLRATMRDAQFHGYEATRYANGTILSLLEDGTVTLANSQRMADERRSALCHYANRLPTLNVTKMLPMPMPEVGVVSLVSVM